MLTSHQPGRINPSWVKQCVFNMLHHGQLELHTHGDKTECRVANGVRLMELDIPPSLRGENVVCRLIDLPAKIFPSTTSPVREAQQNYNPTLISDSTMFWHSVVLVTLDNLWQRL